MKANELMIGDWVYLNYWDGKYAQQIHGINYHSWKGEGYADWVDTEIDDEASIENIEPIPLTPENLEKNGCTMVDKGDYGEWHIKENPNIPLWQHTEFIIFGGIEIHYVHELQHALRLCGLNELADNFKV